MNRLFIQLEDNELRTLFKLAIHRLVSDNPKLQMGLHTNNTKESQTTFIQVLNNAIGWDAEIEIPIQYLDEALKKTDTSLETITEEQFFNEQKKLSALNTNIPPDNQFPSYFYDLINELRFESDKSSILDLDGISLQGAYKASFQGNPFYVETNNLNDNLKFHLYKYVFQKRKWTIHHRQNAFSSLKEEKNLKRFDEIISLPALRQDVTLDIEFLESDHGKYFSTSDYASLQITQSLAYLSHTGRAFVLTNGSPLLQKGRREKVREGWINNNELEGVIELPTGLVPNISIPSYLLIFNRSPSKDSNNGLRVLSAAHIFSITKRIRKLNPDDIQAIVKLYLSKGEHQYLKMVTNKTLEENQYSLLPLRYLKNYEVQLPGQEVSCIDETKYKNAPFIPLHQLCTVMAGFNKKSSGNDTDPIKMISASALRDGSVDLSVAETVLVENSDKIERAKIRKHDILVASRGHQVKIGLVEAEPTDAIYASNNLLILRPTTSVDPYFIYVYLDSPFGKLAFENIQKGTTIPMVTKRDVSDIRVPDVSIDIQNTVANAYQVAIERYRDILKKADIELNETKTTIYSKLGLLDILKTQGTK